MPSCYLTSYFITAKDQPQHYIKEHMKHKIQQDLSNNTATRQCLPHRQWAITWTNVVLLPIAPSNRWIECMKKLLFQKKKYWFHQFNNSDSQAHLTFPMCTHVNMQWVNEWVIKFNSLFGTARHWGPYSPYKPCNHNLYIGIIIFPHTDNTQYTGYN